MSGLGAFTKRAYQGTIVWTVFVCIVFWTPHAACHTRMLPPLVLGYWMHLRFYTPIAPLVLPKWTITFFFCEFRTVL
ncbi:hypothetical protein C6501_19705 [Candidatus Poribacteria bacterium]|nr:MAG: hypothetical protein C6501_19705 [Candidatus Poribacteria bacterium]